MKPAGGVQFKRGLLLATVLVVVGLRVGGAGEIPAPVFVPLADARAVLETASGVPAALRSLSPEALAVEWPKWVRDQDAQVRSRVARGEEDSLAFFLLYGVGFTSEPRATDGYRATLLRRFDTEADVDRRVHEVLVARARDLATALAHPGDDERLLTMLDVARRAGHGTATSADGDRLGQYLLDNVVRVLIGYRAYTSEVQAAARAKTESDFGPPPSLFKDRGLSTDTSVLVDYAVEQALQEFEKQGLVAPGSVRRAGVIGPGLDLIDKDGGYDLFPPQSTQPLVFMDTLLRLGLADAAALEVATFDVSSRVIGHLDRVVNRARAGVPYTLHVVRDEGRGWSAGAVRFWEGFGSRIGTAAEPTKMPDYEGVLTREIQVEPRWAARLRPMNLDIVYQQLRLADADRYDLLLATNIFLYYSPFEQSLAMRNVAGLLRPGGILLSNTELPEGGDSELRRVGTASVRVAGPDGHSFVCYRRGP